jgi:hypothetical protein
MSVLVRLLLVEFSVKPVKEARMPHSNKKVEVCLSDELRGQLETLSRSRSAPASQVRRSRVLLLADEDRREGHRPDWYIAEQVGISMRQVCRIRQQFVRDGVAPTLERKQRSDAGIPKKIDGDIEARLVTLCCSEPPAGRQRWTLSLLVEELSRMEVVASVCRETVRKTLKKIDSNRGKQNASVFPSETALASWPIWRKP